MKKLILIPLFLSLGYAWGPVDKTVTWIELPDKENKFEIVEEDMDVTFKNAYDEYMRTHDIREEFRKSIMDKRKLNVKMDSCSQTNSEERYPDYKIEEDIKLPSGKVLVKKGTKPKILFEQAFDFCVFDGSNEENNELLMKKYPDSCVFIANNADVIDLGRKYNKKVYPLTYYIKEKLDIKCLPVQIHFKGNKETYNYINIEDLKK